MKERAVFEAKLQKLAEANRKLELRTREFERTKDLKGECDAAEKKERDEEGAAPSATLAKHRDILDSIDQEIEGAREAVEKQRKAYEGEQRGFFDRHESLQIQVIADTDQRDPNIKRIRKETQAKIRGDENKWQNDAARWLSTGRRKVELKKREDADMEAAKRRRGQHLDGYVVPRRGGFRAARTLVLCTRNPLVPPCEWPTRRAGRAPARCPSTEAVVGCALSSTRRAVRAVSSSFVNPRGDRRAWRPRPCRAPPREKPTSS